jgi:hypothetical protein
MTGGGLSSLSSRTFRAITKNKVFVATSDEYYLPVCVPVEDCLASKFSCFLIN